MVPHALPHRPTPASPSTKATERAANPPQTRRNKPAANPKAANRAFRPNARRRKCGGLRRTLVRNGVRSGAIAVASQGLPGNMGRRAVGLKGGATGKTPAAPPVSSSPKATRPDSRTAISRGRCSIRTRRNDGSSRTPRWPFPAAPRRHACHGSLRSGWSRATRLAEAGGD